MVQHDTPPTAGWDWASATHVVAVVDNDGIEMRRWAVEHKAADLRGACRRLTRMGVERVGIERPDGPVVEALWAARLQVVMIPPRQLKELRGRYGSAGNKDDRFDAFVLADTLRTDAARLRLLEPDTPPTVALRDTCRARKDLVETRVALGNQLRAHLQVTFPGAVGLFADLDSPISLAFLRRFPSVNRAAWLSERRLAAWLDSVGYCGRQDPAVLYGRLQDAPRGIDGDAGDIHATTTMAYVTAIDGIATQAKTLEQRIREQLATHPDGPIFTSFPRAGRGVRAATLLGEMGDCRARFPSVESLTCLGGVAPSTRQSGKLRAVTARWACDKKLRDALTDFVSDSRFANPWAAHIYDRAIARDHTHPQAERVLARAWSYVIWRCWQDRTLYDPAKHRALQRLLNPDERAAA